MESTAFSKVSQGAECKLCQDSSSFCETLNTLSIPDLHFRFLLCGDDITAHLEPSDSFSPAHPRPQGLGFALPSLKGKRVQTNKKVHRLFNGVMATSLSRPPPSYDSDFQGVDVRGVGGHRVGRGHAMTGRGGQGLVHSVWHVNILLLLPREGEGNSLCPNICSRGSGD